MLSPAIIGTTHKSTPSFLDDNAIIASACQAMIGNPVALPVFSTRGIFLGVARGLGCTSPYSAWYDKRYFIYNSYDDFISKTTKLEQKYTTIWGKSFNTTWQHNWNDLWPLGVNPAPGDYSGTAATARQFLSTTTGALPHGGAVTPKTKTIVSSMVEPMGLAHMFMLYDRVLTYDNSPYNTGVQSMTNTLPALRYATDPGLQIMITSCTTTGATASNLTLLTYINQAGVSHTIPTTPTVAMATSLFGGQFDRPAKIVAPTSDTGGNGNGGSQIFLSLQPADTGVQSITNYTTSGNNTGTLCFALVKPILLIPSHSYSPAPPVTVDHLASFKNLMPIKDDSCLSLAAFGGNGSVGSTISGSFTFGWG